MSKIPTWVVIIVRSPFPIIGATIPAVYMLGADLYTPIQAALSVVLVWCAYAAIGCIVNLWYQRRHPRGGSK